MERSAAKTFPRRSPSPSSEALRAVHVPPPAVVGSWSRARPPSEGGLRWLPIGERPRGRDLAGCATGCHRWGGAPPTRRPPPNGRPSRLRGGHLPDGDCRGATRGRVEGGLSPECPPTQFHFVSWGVPLSAADDRGPIWVAPAGAYRSLPVRGLCARACFSIVPCGAATCPNGHALFFRLFLWPRTQARAGEGGGRGGVGVAGPVALLRARAGRRPCPPFPLLYGTLGRVTACVGGSGWASGRLAQVAAPWGGAARGGGGLAGRAHVGVPFGVASARALPPPSRRPSVHRLSRVGGRGCWFTSLGLTQRRIRT